MNRFFFIPTVGDIPDIQGIQAWIEKAWKAGFDEAGSEEFGGLLLGTDYWIGATECAALLRYFGFRAIVVDFSMDKEEIKKCQERSKISRSLIRRRKKRKALAGGDDSSSSAKKKRLAAILKNNGDPESCSDYDSDSDDGDFEGYDPEDFSDQPKGGVLQRNCGDNNQIILINDDEDIVVGVNSEFAATVAKKEKGKERKREKGKELDLLSDPGSVNPTTGKDAKKRKLEEKATVNDLSAAYADDLIPGMGNRVFSWVTRYFYDNKVTQNMLLDDIFEDKISSSSSSSSAILSNTKGSTLSKEGRTATAVGVGVGAGACSGSSVLLENSWVGYGTGPKYPLYFQYQGHSRTIIGNVRLY